MNYNKPNLLDIKRFLKLKKRKVNLVKKSKKPIKTKFKIYLLDVVCFCICICTFIYLYYYRKKSKTTIGKKDEDHMKHKLKMIKDMNYEYFNK